MAVSGIRACPGGRSAPHNLPGRGLHMVWAFIHCWTATGAGWLAADFGGQDALTEALMYVKAGRAFGAAEVGREQHRERPERREIATWELPMTLSPKANMAGVMVAVRVARRSAVNPRSRWPSHRRGCK